MNIKRLQWLFSGHELPCMYIVMIRSSIIFYFRIPCMFGIIFHVFLPRHMITCGQDGDVRIFQGVDDDECTTHTLADSVYAVAYMVYLYFSKCSLVISLYCAQEEI